MRRRSSGGLKAWRKLRPAIVNGLWPGYWYWQVRRERWEPGSLQNSEGIPKFGETMSLEWKSEKEIRYGSDW